MDVNGRALLCRIGQNLTIRRGWYLAYVIFPRDRSDICVDLDLLLIIERGSSVSGAKLWSWRV